MRYNSILLISASTDTSICSLTRHRFIIFYLLWEAYPLRSERNVTSWASKNLHVALDSLYISKLHDQLLPVHCKLHKRDFSTTVVQQISKRFTVLERVIQVLHFLLCKSLEVFVHRPENGAQMVQPSSMHYVKDWFRFYRKLLKPVTFNSNDVIGYFWSAA